MQVWLTDDFRSCLRMGGRMSSEVECTSTNEVKEELVWEGVPETEGGGITNVH